MYPTLYHFFLDTFGIEIPFLKAVNSFGFFVAMAFLVGTWLFTRELKRKEQEGELKAVKKTKLTGLPPSTTGIVLNAVLGFFLGYKLIYAFMHSEVFSAFPKFLFSPEGSFIAGILGAALFGYWKYRDDKKQQKPTPVEITYDFHSWDHVGPLLILAVIWGFLGAKIFAWFESGESLSSFLSGDPFRGLTMYGGLICATIAMTVYMIRHKLPVLKLYDAAAPGLLLAYGVGRIGCQVSGDGDWGIVNTAPKPGWMGFLPDWLWSYNYPNNVNEDCGRPGCNWEETPYLLDPVFPTPLYEFLMCLFGFWILWMLRKRIHVAGIIFMSFLILNGVERYLIEQIRVNENIDGTGMTQAELISIILIVIGFAGIIFLSKRKNKLVT
jgi:phosphatidylglycerol---prolipoprotein diacylglyceryl transferase